MWPFPVRIIDDTTVEWQLQAFEWLINRLCDGAGIAGTSLVVPGRSHFIADGEQGHALALRLFEQVKAYVRVDDTTVIHLLQQPERRGSIVNERTALVHQAAEPLGTCLANDEGDWEISYDPALLSDREGLIATLAHEVAHVLVPMSDDLPVEPEEYEFLTDLCVAFLGFGVFLSNGRSERITDGEWSWWRGGGYLPINDCLMATALFIDIKGSPADRDTANSFLQPAWRPAFGKAFKQLRRFDGEIARLRALDRRLTKERTVETFAEIDA
ncbi:hypothetical protein E8L99_14265 [Phreatobacter aquaticus]|uniref:Peptidase n=1 Tax=Phreatobacter aquaticus TaxID=2570229 RepID=A0A4D7QII1_9HYPH|nr:hypothetical protein [Phreatobacter aquaticus]QCK86835.1 hypothetical protein E8L99_14265 [Phreatobacter aquaticus]